MSGRQPKMKEKKRQKDGRKTVFYQDNRMCVFRQAWRVENK